MHCFYVHRYRLVRYETMAADPLRATVGIFEWAGVHFTTEVFDTVVNLTSSDATRNRYYDVQRGPDFRPDAWTREMDPQDIAAVEEACAEAMKKYGYPRWQEQDMKRQRP